MRKISFWGCFLQWNIKGKVVLSQQFILQCYQCHLEGFFFYSSSITLLSLCVYWRKYLLSHTNIIRSSRFIVHPYRQMNCCSPQELECTTLTYVTLNKKSVFVMINAFQPSQSKHLHIFCSLFLLCYFLSLFLNIFKTALEATTKLKLTLQEYKFTTSINYTVF